MRALLTARANDTIALSTSVFDEISDVLARRKFAAVLSAARRAAILELLVAGATWFEPVERVLDCIDPADNKYLDLALTAQAAVLVSSDDHLLRLNPWRAIRILRPAAYLASHISTS
jgi:putative PIN family toxin of toxin-antitoxin system